MADAALGGRMKAWVRDSYGGPEVLRLEDVPRPAPQAGEVLVRVQAAAVNAADWHVLRADPMFARLFLGVFRPKFRIVGNDVAGTVEAVGPGVTRFKPGDTVFGDTFQSGLGGYAEYASMKEDSLAMMPAGVSLEEAAAVPTSAGTALQGLRDRGRLQAGQAVLIHGASGGVGTFAVQIAKAFGARVTAVCSARTGDLVRSLGADRVLDYAREDFARDAARYDLVLAVSGARPIFDYLRVLRPGGRYVTVGGSTMRHFYQAALLGPWLARRSGKAVIFHSASIRAADLVFLADLMRAGKLKSVIDVRYPFAQVPDAIRHLEQAHARGKIVIAM